MRLNLVLASGFVIGAVASISLLAEIGDARADSSCNVSGSAVMGADVKIYDKNDGGSAIARFTGGSTPLVASDFFAGGGSRVKAKTSSGSAGFRIDGWVNAADLPLYTARDAAVVPNHVWIAAQREVRAVSLSSGKLRVKRYVGEPFAQTFTASAACSAVSFTGSTPSGWSPSGNARGYVAKKDVELFDSEAGTLVSVLTPSSGGNGILLWSTEKKGNWVHVEHHSDVIVDAWAKASDLHALPEGETMDQQAPPTIRRGSPQAKLASNPREVHASKDVTIRDAASASGKAIGTIESGADVYVLDIVATWASVLPKSLNVMPVGDGQFWAKASDLGVSP